jgi:outer membrane protein OmpA-like peptidoglycan-associated protein
MAVSHVYNQTVADGTATSVVRPSDWNSAHNQYLTFGGNTAGVSTVSGTNIVFAGGNNVTLSANGQTVSFVAPSQTVQTQGSVQIQGSTGPISFANGNGVTFGFNASTITASVQTNYLTTAALSNHSHGNPTLNLTNLSGTTNSASNGLTLSLSAAAQSVQTQNMVSVQGSTGPISFGNANGLTFGFNASTVTASHNGLTSQSNQAVSGANGSSTFQTLGFVDGGGVSWSTTAGGVRASVQTNYLTTARASNDAIGLNSALTANGVSMTANSSGLSLNFPAFLTTAAQSNHSHGNPTLALTNLSGTTASASNGFTLSLSAAAPGGGGGIANAAGTQTATSGTVAFVNSNGITFGMSDSSQITASHNGIQFVNVSAGTTSNNLTNLVFSNSNGMSFGLNGSTVTGQQVIAISAGTVQNGRTNFVFSNSNNVSFGLNVATITASFSQSVQPAAYSGSNGSFTASTLSFGNLNGLSFYTSNGSIVGSYTDAGGGGGGNGIAADTRTAGGGSTVLFSNANGVTFGLDAVNGSVMTASVAAGGGGETIGGVELFELNNGTVFSTLGQNSMYFQKFVAWGNFSFNNLELRASGSSASSSISAQAAHTYDYGLYSRGTGASSTLYSQITSNRLFIQASYSSNLSAGYTVSQGAGSFTSTSAGTVIMSALSGFKHLYMPFTSTITAGGQYAIAMRMSSATTGNTGPLRLGVKQMTMYSNLSIGRIDVNNGISISNASRVGDFAQGVYSATSSNLPGSIAISGFTNAVSQARMYIQFEV